VANGTQEGERRDGIWGRGRQPLQRAGKLGALFLKGHCASCRGPVDPKKRGDKNYVNKKALRSVITWRPTRKTFVLKRNRRGSCRETAKLPSLAPEKENVRPKCSGSGGEAGRAMSYSRKEKSPGRRTVSTIFIAGCLKLVLQCKKGQVSQRSSERASRR